MRIVFMISNLSGGGAEFVVREWARELDRLGHEVVVLVSHPKLTDSDFFSGSIVSLGSGGPRRHVWSARREIKRIKPHIVVGLMPYYNLLAILSTIGQSPKPMVGISGRNVEYPFPAVHGKYYRTTRFLSRLLFPQADRFIAISHPVAAEAQALFGLRPDRVRVVPNPATAKVGEPRPGSEAPTGAPLRVVVPGRLADQKRPLVAVDTIRELRERGFAAELHFFGTGELEASIRSYAKSHAVDVTFHGWRERWFEEAPAGSIVLLPSLVEGFGNVFVEAAAVGMPSVASSACLGAADAIVPGITGSLVQGSHASAYAEGVLAADEIERVQAPRWLARFSPESSAKALLEAFDA